MGLEARAGYEDVIVTLHVIATQIAAGRKRPVKMTGSDCALQHGLKKSKNPAESRALTRKRKNGYATLNDIIKQSSGMQWAILIALQHCRKHSRCEASARQGDEHTSQVDNNWCAVRIPHADKSRITSKAEISRALQQRRGAGGDVALWCGLKHGLKKRKTERNRLL
jgi:hypothetical protein